MNQRVFKQFFIVMLLLCTSFLMQAQQEYWYYLTAHDTLFTPHFSKQNNRLVYKGEDQVLKEILAKHHLIDFKKTYKDAKKEDLKRTFFVRTTSEHFLEEVLGSAAHVFRGGKKVPEEAMKIFEPNDYGLTSTIGENKGFQVNLDYLDVMGLPQAWYYTTGDPEVIVGVSDAYVDASNKEFASKIQVVDSTFDAKGHGSGVAAIAVAQGNNGFGIPGVCYDCGLYTTRYGDFKELRQLKELSKLGAKVINCSWVGRKFYPEAQAVIDSIFNQGTIIVAGAGNKGWDVYKGDVLYYPASYDKVISVSSAMHRYETVEDNIGYSAKGNPYAVNIRGYVGRTVGFKNNDITQRHHIWPESTTTLNSEVDLVTPTVGVLRYSKFVTNNSIEFTKYEATSGAAPFVTGAIGLLYSLVPCLPTDEVESILKCTATNLDNLPANKPYQGMYGAGMLHVGRAVELAHNLYSKDDIAVIENQSFSRWQFKLTAYSKKVVLKNQRFTENARLKVTSKNAIVLKPNTILKPNFSGKVELQIAPELEQPCELRKRS